MTYKETFDEWLKTRPPAIQEFITVYPPGAYKVIEDAPYSLTAPGTTVQLISWKENGTVGVVILAKDKTEATLSREKELCEEHGRTPEETDNIHKLDIKAQVDPQYLELVKSELDEVG